MFFRIFTLFPEVFEKYLGVSVLKRALDKKIIRVKTYNIRDFANDKHKTTDDSPYGGGAGMVMKAEPILKAVFKELKNKPSARKIKIAILSAKGKQFNQKIAYLWAKKYDEVFLICGRYEGIDERVKSALKAEEISIGPYVLTDGDVGAMALISSVARLVPGVIKMESLQEESHWNVLLKKEKNIKTGLALEYPHYTRPEVFEFNAKKYPVPKILLSGDHKKIKKWRETRSKIK
ncbi:MAG: tRNA (guanosine(37)-N1)-methyltransferase TrmD [Candidatus Pacebacteria bacterium]|nr:tRNA (guanosine(37)-N1)-methyltransferase TrmD [Candidatus Paceibacterota bacterium]